MNQLLAYMMRAKRFPMGEPSRKQILFCLLIDSDNQFSKGTSARVNQYAHLSLQEFKLNEDEIEAKNKLSTVIFEVSFYAVLHRFLCQIMTFYCLHFENVVALNLDNQSINPK